MLYGQTRLVFAMCRDGLLPPGLSVTSRRGAPVRLSAAATLRTAQVPG